MMQSFSVVIFLLGTLVSLAFVEAQAQVNFSPAWGKRAPGIALQSRDLTEQNPSLPLFQDCKLPFDGALKVIKLIQLEAQRILRCGGIPGDIME